MLSHTNKFVNHLFTSILIEKDLTTNFNRKKFNNKFECMLLFRCIYIFFLLIIK